MKLAKLVERAGCLGYSATRARGCAACGGSGRMTGISSTGLCFVGWCSATAG